MREGLSITHPVFRHNECHATTQIFYWPAITRGLLPYMVCVELKTQAQSTAHATLEGELENNHTTLVYISMSRDTHM